MTYTILNDDQSAPIVGTANNDLISGTSGNDIIYGMGATYDPNDYTAGDSLYGGAGNDLIYAGSQGNPLTGGGIAYLYGGGGNDTLVGGGSSNILDGSDGIHTYSGEIDELVGGGYNTDNVFVLGNGTDVYYFGDGGNDYAKISHFNNGANTLQLTGDSSWYHFEVDPNLSTGSLLFYVKDGNHDLIAKIDKNLTDTFLDQNSGYVYYV